jgi:putative SOS response-associated peptidase YedK
VPVDGFFEWKAIKGQKAKQPYAIAMKDGSPFGIGALWRRKAAVTDVANNETHALHSRCGTKVEGCKLLRSRRSGLFSLD